MKKKIKLLLTIALILSLLLGFTASAATVTGDPSEVPFGTYNYRFGDTFAAVPTKAIYETETQLTSISLGVEAFATLDDICTDKDGRLYLLDGKASKITVLDDKYIPVKVISAVVKDNGESVSFNDAKGIYVDKSGSIYIADTAHASVLICDIEGKLIKELLLPDSNLIPEDFNYRPIKITVDSRGYTYVLSDGSYYGALLYSPEEEFLGFYGANSVALGIGGFIEKLWENLTTTNDKRAASSSRLPYQFTDLYADSGDFIYTATGKIPKSGQVGQIKRLSPGGKNILDSDDFIFGDIETATINNKLIEQNVSGVAADSRDFIYCYDNSYGRVFVYNSDCYMLGGFGGGLQNGDQKGTFVQITAIDILNDGEKIAVLDSSAMSVTIFRETQFGATLKEACEKMNKGKYSETTELWSKILRADAGNQLANIGLAKAAISEKNYKTALKYSKDGYDYETYSQAFTYLRKAYLKEHFDILMLGLLAVIGVFIAVIVIIRKKKIVLIKNAAVREMLYSPLHPAQVFGEVKAKKKGSVILGIIIMVLFYVSAITKSTASAFLFRDSGGSFNSVIVLIQTVGFVVLWTVVNWAVATLLGGIGKVREIFIVVTYGILPMVISNVLYTILSYALNDTEGVFLSVLSVAALLFSVFMIVIGLMIMHDILFGRFIGITILTFIGMLIVIFLLVLIIILVQETYGFIGTLLRELFFR